MTQPKVLEKLQELQRIVGHEYADALGAAIAQLTALRESLAKSATGRTVAGPSTVLEEVAARHGCTVEDLLSSCRLRRFVKARAEVAKVLRGEPYKLSLSEIGRLLGGRDHATVMNYLRRDKNEI